MDCVSLYGPTSTRIRLFGPWLSDAGKPLSLSACATTSASACGTAITCQYEPAGPSGAAGTVLCAGWVAGRAGSDDPAAGVVPGVGSAGAGGGGVAVAPAGCGRLSAGVSDTGAAA